ncbi:hypothetical protein [Borrelia sp. RT1S]|uniref:hypothetical protein n=1 Tax=Borrelia sp. RT1S TaxID=2898580 RepID=UPI001E3F7339|nr:hypothetical protein [Borrelia sp. RT1S]UGQ17891.1 hypothetical protein LSO05_05520 [Borrelia sp. RT1S]
MRTGLFYFFGRSFTTERNKKIYISHLYEKLISIEADPDQRWLKIFFARPDNKGSRYFYLFTRDGTNGKFISCNFFGKTNYGLDIDFSDGNLSIFCQDKQSLETLKARAEEFLKAPKKGFVDKKKAVVKQDALEKKAVVKQDALKKKAVVKQDALEKKAVVKLKKTRVLLRRVIKKA